jgi:hypothetical protein
MNNTLSHNYSHARICFEHDFNGIRVYRESLLNNVFLSYVYFFIYLLLITTVAYGIITSSGDANVPYWDILLHKIIAVIGIPLVITCFLGHLAWVLFNKQELTINSFELNYKLTVIFPIVRHKIQINKIRNVSITYGQCGDFAILFSTTKEPIKVFHFLRYKRSHNLVKNESLYKNEISELTTIIHSIDSFLKQQKEKNADRVTQKTDSDEYRWKSSFTYEGQQFTRFGKIPFIAYILSGVFILFFVGIASFFAVIAFHPHALLNKNMLPIVISLRILMIGIIPVCIYSLISFIIMIIHPFTRFKILVHPNYIVFGRNILGLNLTKRWDYVDIEKINISCTKKRTIRDFLRNPEGMNGQINPAPYSIQFFDQQNKLLGQISDLLLEEVFLFIDIIKDKCDAKIENNFRRRSKYE